MPTGWTLNCSLVPAASSWSAYSFETIEAKSIGKVARTVASGLFSTNFTVMSSTLTISLSEVAMVELKYSQAMPGAYSYQGPSLSNCRWKEKTTSSAFISRVGVNQAVVWNFTPGRRWKVISVPSSEVSQLSARPGSVSVEPFLNSISRL